jgi:hypothetical protein
MSPFIDGDYDTYVAEMADVQTWGGEPELALAAEVLQLPITVYQREQVVLRPNLLGFPQPQLRPSTSSNPVLLASLCGLRMVSQDSHTTVNSLVSSLRYGLHK